MQSNSRTFSTTLIYLYSVMDFYPKGTISEGRVHAGAKFGLTGFWSIANAVRVHGRIAQVDFEVDRPPPADSPAGYLLMTMVKETAKKEFRK